MTRTVRLEGCIDQAGDGDSHAFTLPAGFRPAAETFLPVDLGGAAKGSLVIDPNGDAELFDSGTDQTKAFTSLEGVTFRAR